LIAKPGAQAPEVRPLEPKSDKECTTPGRPLFRLRQNRIFVNKFLFFRLLFRNELCGKSLPAWEEVRQAASPIGTGFRRPPHWTPAVAGEGEEEKLQSLKPLAEPVSEASSA
jgi:hypothetical protein